MEMRKTIHCMAKKKIILLDLMIPLPHLIGEKKGK